MKPNRAQKIKGHIKKGRGGGQGSFLTIPTPRQATRTARAEANIQYNPTQRQIQGQIRGSRAQQGKIGQWYGALTNQINQGRDASQGAYTQANDAIAKDIAAGAQAGNANAANQTAQNATFAKLVGADPNTTNAGNTAAQVAQQRALTQAALAAPIAQSGASAYNYNTQVAGNAQHEGVYQRIQERKRRQSYQSDLAALLKEKGNYTNKALADLRQNAQTYSVQLGTLGATRQKNAVDAAQGAQALALKQQHENNYGYGQHHSSSGKKPKPYGETNYAGVRAQFMQSLGSGKKKASLQYVIAHKQSAIEALIAPPNAVNPKVARRVVNDYIRQEKRKAKHPATGHWSW